MLYHTLHLYRNYFHRNGIRYDYVLEKWIDVHDCIVSKVKMVQPNKVCPSEFLVIATEVEKPITVVADRNSSWPTQADYDFIEDVKRCM